MQNKYSAFSVFQGQLFLAELLTRIHIPFPISPNSTLNNFRDSQRLIYSRILKPSPCSFACVNGIGVIGFPKIEIERKPRRHFQTDFIKLMPQAQGRQQRGKARSSELTWGLGYFYKPVTKWAGFLKKGRLAKFSIAQLGEGRTSFSSCLAW